MIACKILNFILLMDYMVDPEKTLQTCVFFIGSIVVFFISVKTKYTYPVLLYIKKNACKITYTVQNKTLHFPYKREREIFMESNRCIIQMYMCAYCKIKSLQNYLRTKTKIHIIQSYLRLAKIVFILN